MNSFGRGIIEANLVGDMRGCEPERFSRAQPKSGKEIENLALAGELRVGKNIGYDECIGWAEKYKKMADEEEVLSKKAIYRRVEGALYLAVNDIENAYFAYNDVKSTYILQAQRVFGKDGAQEMALAQKLQTYIRDYSVLTSELEEALRPQ